MENVEMKKAELLDKISNELLGTYGFHIDISNLIHKDTNVYQLLAICELATHTPSVLDDLIDNYDSYSAISCKYDEIETKQDVFQFLAYAVGSDIEDFIQTAGCNYVELLDYLTWAMDDWEEIKKDLLNYEKEI